MKKCNILSHLFLRDILFTDHKTDITATVDCEYTSQMDIRDLTTCSGGFSCQIFFRILPDIFIFPLFMPFPFLITIWNITPIPVMRSCILLPVFLPGWHTGHGIPTEIRAIYLYPAGCTSPAGDSGWFSLLDPESGIFPHLRKKPGFSGSSSEKRSRIFPVLEFYGSLPGLLLRRGFPQLRIQPEGSAHLFTTKFRSDTKGRISLLSSVWPYAHRTCFLRPLQPEHPGKCLSEKSAPVY